MARNLPLPELQKAFHEELIREGFTRHEPIKNAYLSLRQSQTRLEPKVVIVTAHAIINGQAVVRVTVNGHAHYPPALGPFSETWRQLLNNSLLVDDIADWRDGRATRPVRR